MYVYKIFNKWYGCCEPLFPVGKAVNDYYDMILKKKTKTKILLSSSDIQIMVLYSIIMDDNAK